MEGTGYETRQTSKEHVIVMVFAWSRGIDPAQANATTVVFQSPPLTMGKAIRFLLKRQTKTVL